MQYGLKRKAISQFLRMRDAVSNIDVDDVLGLVGLERRRNPLVSYVLPIIGALTAGVVAGIGIGMLFAPASGKTLRLRAGEKVNKLKGRVRERAEEMQHEAEEEMNSAWSEGAPHA